MARVDRSSSQRHGKRALAALTVILIALAAYAVDDAVTVQVRWRVLPYQSLRIPGAEGEVGVLRYEIPAPTGLDLSRGMIEDENALQFEIASNTAWKLQVRLAASSPGSAGMQVRRHGGAYVGLSTSPEVVALGTHGVYRLAIDYRIPLDAQGAVPDVDAMDLIYTLMPN